MPLWAKTERLHILKHTLSNSSSGMPEWIHIDLGKDPRAEHEARSGIFLSLSTPEGANILYRGSARPAISYKTLNSLVSRIWNLDRGVRRGLYRM